MKSLSQTHLVTSSGDSFDYWWDMEGTWVEQPNRRRGGESGVQRCRLNGVTYYIKKQVGHMFRSLRHPFGCPTIVREAHRLNVCRQLGVAPPHVEFCGSRTGAEQPRAILVTRELRGYMAVQDWYEREPDGLRKEQLLDAIYSRLAESLAKLHNQRWQHGCLYDKHVFFRIRAEDENDVEDVEIALIDLEKCRRKLTVASASQRDVMQMRRHMPALDGRHWHSFVSAYTRHLNLKSSREKLWLSLTP